MTEEELQEIAGSGFEIGSHSTFHEYLARMPDARLQEDVTRSLEVIDSLRRDHRPVFCYPFGGSDAYDERTIRELRKQGFACAVSSIEGLNTRRTDLYSLRRIRVTGDLPLPALVLRLLGGRAWLWKLRGAVDRLRGTT
jgi:peptidoglycan/xylan/chitin deacetylase (PgdA/CDA1 family)